MSEQTEPTMLIVGGQCVRQLTVKEFAEIERVTERTVWHWIAKGAVAVRRTPGGGVRILDAPLKCNEVR